jgi:hypothetical protein
MGGHVEQQFFKLTRMCWSYVLTWSDVYELLSTPCH